MPLRGRGELVGKRHTGDLKGLLVVAIGIFVALCLFSFDPFDPSLHSYSSSREIQNLGGLIGSYLADFLITLLGYGSYLLPIALMSLGVAGLLHRGRGGAVVKIFGLLLVLLAASVLCHLQLAPIGERGISAGGLAGWGLSRLLSRAFGLVGTYLLTTVFLLVAFVWVTEIPLAQFGKILLLLAKEISSRLTTVSRIFWARAKIIATRFVESAFKKVRSRFQKQKDRIVGREPVIAVEKPKPFFMEKAVDRAVPGPQIRPRSDHKQRSQEQLELIRPPARSDYELPPLSFLESDSQEKTQVDEEGLKLNSKLLETKLKDYGVDGRITEIHPGPVITMYEFEPASGVKVNKIVNLEDDLALTMGGKSVRIIAPLPGKAAVGIEIPNNLRETVWLKDIIGHSRFQKSTQKLSLALGKDTEGIPFVSDLARMPHLLVAGATGSGKSVSINSMVLSLLYKMSPREARLIMVDLKMLELSIYEGIPHLLLPVVTSPRRAALALQWAVKEMERRYEVLSKKSARNIDSYNRQVEAKEQLPLIVIIIDELADLMMTTSHEVERLITRLAQMARAAGIHLILATQRPSVDVITGLIKANFPARISFKVTSKHDSRTIIDTVGSEHLLGAGDMLFMSGGSSHLLRIHGAYVSEHEILKVVEHCKNQGKPEYLEESVLKELEQKEEAADSQAEEGAEDELYDQAVSLVTETRQASISMVQRRLRIGYNRAARLIERMEREGVVGPADGAKPREVYAGAMSGIEG